MARYAATVCYSTGTNNVVLDLGIIASGNREAYSIIEGEIGIDRKAIFQIELEAIVDGEPQELHEEYFS